MTAIDTIVALLCLLCMAITLTDLTADIALYSHRLFLAQYQENTEEHECGAGDNSRRNRFTCPEVSDGDCDDGVNVSIAGDTRRRHVAKKPDKSGESNQRSENDEIEERPHGPHRDVRKRVHLPESC